MDALVQRKAFLLERYLSITQEMKAFLLKDEAEKLGALLARRQKCIEEVDKTDIRLSKAAMEEPGKGFMERDHGHIRSLLSRIECLDRELGEQIRKDRETLKNDLLKMQSVRGATGKYRGYAGQEPRFLDVRDQ